MRRRFFNAADNFVGGCYNKLSNEDIKRLGGKRPYVCQFNKIHIHIGPVLKDHDSDVSDIVFNSDWNYGNYESTVYHITCTIRRYIFSEKHFLKKISGYLILNLILS